MSDTITPTETTTPDAGAVTQAATPATEAAPAAQPFAVFQDAKAFNQRLTREARKLMNEQAKAAGFDDWQHANEALGALRRDASGPGKTDPAALVAPENPQDAPGTTPAPTRDESSITEAKRLRMALSVASDLSLPTALVARLQGDTPEEMKADGERLLALFQQPQRGPGIPPAPRQNQPVVFTQRQLQDPKFVREHMKEIQQAFSEGRIVDS